MAIKKSGQSVSAFMLMSQFELLWGQLTSSGVTGKPNLHQIVTR